MIRNQDRSGWFGASDTATVMGNWNTKTFAEWWAVKLGIYENRFTNKYMEFGNLAEHAIIDAYDRTIKKGRRPIYIPRYKIRVNLDGLKRERVVEVKTTSKPMKHLPKNYWMQTQAEMLAAKRKKTLLIIYRTIPEEYARPYFLDVDRSRISTMETFRDDKFLDEYMERIRYLSRCLARREYP